jgi:hypothetical protein
MEGSYTEISRCIDDDQVGSAACGVKNLSARRDVEEEMRQSQLPKEKGNIKVRLLFDVPDWT